MLDQTQRKVSSSYQPRFKPHGLEKPRPEIYNFCGLPGHLERECEIQTHIDRAKDWEHKILKQKKHRQTEGHVHQVETEEHPIMEPKYEQPPYGEEAYYVVDACFNQLEVNSMESTD